MCWYNFALCSLSFQPTIIMAACECMKEEGENKSVLSASAFASLQH